MTAARRQLPLCITFLIDAAQTAYPAFEGRLLGQSTTIQVPQLAVWVTTGNNVTLSAEGVRRCLHIRLEPQVERPEERTGFTIPNLVAHVCKHHSEFVMDALTILRAYCLAGRPSFGLKIWGSFEEWSALVRNAVYWVLGVDCDTREALAIRADSTRAAQGALVLGLGDAFGVTPFTTEQVWSLFLAQEPRHSRLNGAIEELNVNPKGLTNRSLGRLLLRAIGAVHCGWRLDLQDTKRAGSCVWVLRRAGEPGSGRGFGGIGGSAQGAASGQPPPAAKGMKDPSDLDGSGWVLKDFAVNLAVSSKTAGRTCRLNTRKRLISQALSAGRANGIRTRVVAVKGPIYGPCWVITGVHGKT